ncbi:hypothetical protein R1sor_001392 [Riccia sorocarpa]|uniref:Serine/threonine-protein phosphatase 4 regulatory subunit 3-like central domain-containing protein n=1 Tax=Riccia sorocarpa TaxID=122646 RepID=A0ABD3GVU2_9MARC
MFAQLFERVKVYRLNDGGKWDDKGTGHVSLEYLERSEAVGLVVIDEENNQTLLIHRISADDIYRRQEDTIISWTDPEVATDLALSFQETMSCSYIWDQICSVQRSIQFPAVGALDSVPRPINDDMEHSGMSQDDGLPLVELGNLPQLVKAIAEVPHFDRDRIAALILREQNYIRKIIELFRMCEDLENLEALHMLFKIVKGIISLNDVHIFDDIFSEEFIMDIVGALEYDPEIPIKQNYRAFLKEQVVYKEVVPIRDPTILSKIHQTYRIGYIKDVILPRVLDDQTFATFNSIMLFNNVAVVSALQNDSAFLSELFTKLWSPNTSERGRRDLILFVQEFCNLSKHLQPALRNQLLGALVAEGLFDIVTNTLQSSDESVRLSGSDILIVISNHRPPLLRAFLVQQQGQVLFSVLVKGMLTPGEGGFQSQMLEIMRTLLDSDTMDPAQTDKFLDVFYDKYMDQLIEVLTAGCPAKSVGDTNKQSSASPSPSAADISAAVVPPSQKNSVTPEILMSICELMCFCVQHHRFRIKYYVMRNNVVEKILRLTRRKEKYLVVAAVRFLRTCIALKDEFYNRYLVKNNLFQPVIQAFLANGSRYNLLNSAVLELIDFIRKENISILIAHLVENFAEKLECVDYVETVQALKLKFEQSQEGAASVGRDAGGAVMSSGPDHGSMRVRERLNQMGSLADTRKRRDERALDKDEEDYFAEDSDEEEDTASAQESAGGPALQSVNANGNVLVDASVRNNRIVGLVDYEDEDEETPVSLESNGKEVSLEKKVDNILSPLPISEPVWPEMEDFPGKRRMSPSLESQESLEIAATKRRKSECEEVKNSLDIPAAKGADGVHSQRPAGDDRLNSSEVSMSDDKTSLPGGEAKENTSAIDQSREEKREPEGQNSVDPPAESEAEGSNGYGSRRRGADCEYTGERQSALGERKGSLEGSESIGIGAKENSTHPVSLGSDVKLASLGSEILRGGTQPSPGSYTVR